MPNHATYTAAGGDISSFYPYEQNTELLRFPVFVFMWWVTGTMAIAKPCRLYCCWWRWRHFYSYERNSELTQVPGVCVHVVGDWDDGHCLLHRRLCLDHGARHRHAYGVHKFFKIKNSQFVLNFWWSLLLFHIFVNFVFPEISW